LSVVGCRATSFSQALKAVNSKLKSFDSPVQKPVVVERHSVKTLTKPAAASATKKKKPGKAKGKAAAADDDEEFEIPSPPTAGERETCVTEQVSSQCLPAFYI